MKAAAFDYARPRDVAEAVKLLAEGGEGAKPAAGTQSLGPMLNLRVVHPTLLVDLRHIEELRTATETPDAVTFGACVTHAAIEDGRTPDPTRGFMREVASNIAYRAVRNRGTIGGSLVHADPAADWPSALALLGATAVIAGPRGRREMPVEKFVTGLFETALAPGEILVCVRVPIRAAGSRFGYWKFCRKAGEFAQAIGAALRDPERGQARAVLGALQGTPYLVADAGDLLRNPDDAACGSAADAAGAGNDAYSRQLHAVALKRAAAKVVQ